MSASTLTPDLKEANRQVYEKGIRKMQERYGFNREDAIDHLAGWGIFDPDAEPIEDSGLEPTDE